ncbi:MAG: pyridoxamine 5'-phosphate oxidase family protein [Defluviitaleaceae bacterium]|nr:pyridoxamine 5'-phosphate oxidase family protein [Defluviitaleaceae bacterium]
MNENIFERSNQLIKTCKSAYLGVIDENWFPSVSTVMPVSTNDIFEIFFATGLGSNKVKRLRLNDRVSICFHTGGNNITLVGTAEILTDQDTKSKYWQNVGLAEHFSLGEADPNYCIIKITTKRVSLWVDNEDAQFTIDEFMTICKTQEWS